MNKFDFLKKEWFEIYEIMIFVEELIEKDSNIALMKLKQVVDLVSTNILKANNIQKPVNLLETINLLSSCENVNYEAIELFHEIRIASNKAEHGMYPDKSMVKSYLDRMFNILVWFAIEYGKEDYENIDFNNMPTESKLVFYEYLMKKQFKKDEDKEKQTKDNNEGELLVNPLNTNDEIFEEEKSINNINTYERDIFETKEEYYQRIRNKELVNFGKIYIELTPNNQTENVAVFMFSILKELPVKVPNIDLLYINKKELKKASIKQTKYDLIARLDILNGKVCIDVNNIYIEEGNNKCEVHALVLDKSWYKDDEEYKNNISSVDDIPLGIVKLDKYSYDIEKEILPVSINYYEWLDKYSFNKEGVIHIDRYEAKSLCEESLLYSLVGKLDVFEGILLIKYSYLQSKTLSKNIEIKFDNEDYKQKLCNYIEQAEKGDAEAMNNIGHMYHFGQGVARDYEEAMNWYRKAAKKGYVAAMNSIGHMYHYREGVDQDYKEAMNWYRKAAKKGDVAAMNNIGYMYEHGQGVEEDYEEAMKWYEKAAEKGHVVAMNSIGHIEVPNIDLLYIDKKGIDKACIKQGKCKLITGLDMTNNAIRVDINNIHIKEGNNKCKVHALVLDKSWYKDDEEYKNNISSIDDIPLGIVRLDKYKYDMENEMLPVSINYYEWLDEYSFEKDGVIYINRHEVKTLCEENLLYSLNGKLDIINGKLSIKYCYLKSQILDKNIGIKFDKEEYKPKLEKHVEHVKQVEKDDVKSKESTKDIEHIYEHGEEVEQDYEGSIAWYKKAAREGNVEAMNKVGDMYANGQGVIKDYEEAMVWYKKAAEKGNAEAMNNIGYMYEHGQGVVEDYEKAMSWYKKAASKGYKAAINNIDDIYEHKQKVEQDHEQTMDLYKKATEEEYAVTVETDEIKFGKIYVELTPNNQTEKIGVFMFSILKDLSVEVPNIDLLYINKDDLGKASIRQTRYDLIAKLNTVSGKSRIDINNIYIKEGDNKCKVHALVLDKSWYKDDEEYEATIASVDDIPLGIARLDKYRYDLEKELLPVLINYYEWLGKYSFNKEGFIHIDRYEAKSLCEENLLFSLIGKLDIFEGVLLIKYSYLQSKTLNKNIEIKFDNEDCKQKLYHYKECAEKGNAEAMNNIGHMYEQGEGIEQDYEKAIDWYRKAAVKGYAIAMNNIGDMYRLGKGEEQNYEEAISWYKKAAEKGYVDAMNNMGDMYEHGQGVVQDYKEAMNWYKRAAVKGDAEAMSNIGYMYEHGYGVEQDYEEAINWYKKAAVKGHAIAMNNIGHMYHFGEGIEQDYAEAMKWYKGATEKGYVAAMNNIGYMYEHGEGVEQDYVEAMRWYKKAAEEDEIVAMYNIGHMYHFGHGVEQDYKKALEWYEKAAEKGDEYAKSSIVEIKQIIRKGYAIESSSGEEDYDEKENSFKDIFKKYF